MNKKFILSLLFSTFLFNGCSCSMEKNNIVTTDSGLQYIVLHKTDGASPKRGQRVVVHYTGWLEENGKPENKGKKFDSSVDRNDPLDFIVGIKHVIAGWDEGVMLMKVGEKRRFIIPSKLAYGASGIPGHIPPNATLIFDVELLSIG